MVPRGRGLGSKDASSWRWLLATASISAAFAWRALRRRSGLDESGLGLILSLFSSAAAISAVVAAGSVSSPTMAVSASTTPSGLGCPRPRGGASGACIILWRGRGVRCYCARGIVGPTRIWAIS